MNKRKNEIKKTDTLISTNKRERQTDAEQRFHISGKRLLSPKDGERENVEKDLVNVSLKM